MHSKPVKNFTWTKLDEVLYWLNRWFPITRLYAGICRFIVWGRFGWSNYDWDHSYLLQVMLFKMKRMQKSIFVDGHHIPDKHSPQSLKLAIKLCEKLIEDDYYHFYDIHEKKWGESSFITKVDENGRQYTTLGKPGLNAEENELERLEFLSACEKDDAIRKRDTKLFFSIIEKYHQSWWD